MDDAHAFGESGHPGTVATLASEPDRVAEIKPQIYTFVEAHADGRDAYCMSGTLVVRMVETDAETSITTGDFFEIPTGHHAYVEGSEPVRTVLFEPPEAPQ